MNARVLDQPVTHRWTRDQYDRAVDDEIAHNRAQIEPSLAFEKKWIANLEAAGPSKI
jgi:hypothetical protein